MILRDSETLRSILRLTVLLLAFSLSAPLVTFATELNDEQRVADFLDRLGLVDLQVLHLEEILKQGLPSDRQLLFAQRLADLYAGQLMDAAGDQQRSLDILARIRTLTDRIPDADTASLRVMMLQADYNHAESLTVQWVGNSADVEARQQALEILQRITPSLNDYQSELNGQVDRLTDVLANLPEGDERDIKQKEFSRLEAVAGRATYFAGWSNYYLGLIRDEQGAPQIRQSREAFCQLLDVRTDDYQSLDAEWLGLESAWRCRAVIGLGLCEAALGEVDASRDCFNLLEHASVPPDIRDQAAFWYVQGLLNSDRFPEAVEYASEKVSAFNGDASQGKVSLCVTLVKAAFGDRNVTPSGDRRRLGILGLEGLARLGQQTTVEQLLEKYPIDLGDQAGFFLTWLEGRRQLAIAQDSKQDDDYRAAIQKLETALNSPDADRQVSSAARCRYEMAWCYFQLKDFEQAGRLYQMAITGLKAADPKTAAQAAWMAFASYQQLIEEQPRFAAQAVETLTALKRNFPDHAYAKRADYYIDKMKRGSESPEITIRRLQGIQSGEPNYLSARHDICLLSHQRWVNSEPPDREALGKATVDAVRRFLDAARQDRDLNRKVKCCLIAAEIAIDRSDKKTAAVYLDQAAIWIDQLSSASSSVAEYHYRRMQLATAEKDSDGQLRNAKWLSQHAKGTAYELPALIVAARDADQKLAEAKGDATNAALQEAFNIYQRLSQRLGSSGEVIRASKNARVAASKLAGYATQLRQHDAAAALLDQLLSAFPTDKDYLKRAGKSRFEAQQFERSLKYWRKLLAGLTSGSEGWYEAKYYQVVCLEQTDSKMAVRVLRQFQLLNPQLGPPPWQERFRILIDRNG